MNVGFAELTSELRGDADDGVGEVGRIGVAEAYNELFIGEDTFAHCAESLA